MLQLIQNTTPSQPPKLFDLVRAVIRTKHYRMRTEEACFYRIKKYIFCHHKCHSITTHTLKNDYDIRTIQELLGHKDVATTMIYTHVMN